MILFIINTRRVEIARPRPTFYVNNLYRKPQTWSKKNQGLFLKLNPFIKFHNKSFDGKIVARSQYRKEQA